MENKSSTFFSRSIKLTRKNEERHRINPQWGFKKVLDKLKILYENENYLVIEKSAGITVNRSDTTSEEVTLQDLVEEYIQNTQKTQIAGKSGIQLARISDRSDNLTDRKSDSPSIPSFPNDSDVEFRKRSGIVHRLDKETSGLLIIAKNSFAFRNLQAQFKERKVSKSYVALVHGEIKPKTGDINVPIGRLPWNRKRFGVLAGGREAVTRYKVLSVFGSRLSDHSQSVVGTPVQANRQLANQNRKTDNRKPITEYYSLVRLYPKTGRTHQIRVHLKYINHPIFADPLYAGRKIAREDRKILPRVFLHAETISFIDPKTNQKVSYKSELPKELKKFLNSLEEVVN